MSAVRGFCAFCHNPVRESDKAAHRVQGWELERDAGGANQIFAKERLPNVIAHKACAIQHEKVGNQTALSV